MHSEESWFSAQSTCWVIAFYRSEDVKAKDEERSASVSHAMVRQSGGGTRETSDRPVFPANSQAKVELLMAFRFTWRSLLKWKSARLSLSCFACELLAFAPHLLKQWVYWLFGSLISMSLTARWLHITNGYVSSKGGGFDDKLKKFSGTMVALNDFMTVLGLNRWSNSLSNCY